MDVLGIIAGSVVNAVLLTVPARAPRSLVPTGSVPGPVELVFRSSWESRRPR